MSAPIWADLHGAATHFPVALTLCSGACDGAGFLLAGKPSARGLFAAGYWTILGAALGTFPAVVSGLYMTHGAFWGHGALRMHHLFIWPAFGLIVTLATWRYVDQWLGSSAEFAAGSDYTRRRPAFCIYLVGTALAIGLMAGGGYWGGVMMSRAS